MVDAQDGESALVAGDEFRLVIVSTPDAECAGRLAHGLVQERLAACVSQVPGVQSTYRWQGAIESSSEVLLLAKTTAAKLPSLGDWIRKHHPYEVPEIIGLQLAEVERAYGAWLSNSG